MPGASELQRAPGLARGYFSVSTQFENVGDALINRELIRLVAQSMTATVDISRCPPQFLRTLGISGRDDTKLERSQMGFFISMVRDRLRGLRPYYFLNPGGYFGEISTAAAAGSLARIAILIALRAMGVRVCQIGVSYERIGARHAQILRFRAALLYRHMVRDRRSARYAASVGMRVGGTMPDLAFGTAAIGEPAVKERRSLGISFRLDQEGSETTEHVTQLIRSLDEELPPAITFKFVSQVKRDETGLRKLAEAVRRRAHVFCDVSDSIEGCEQAYSDCSYVVGNRLHALLIGALAGAAPLAAIDKASSEKVAGLFEDLGATEYLFDLAGNSGRALVACIKREDRPRIDFGKERERLVRVFSDMFEARDLASK